MSNRRSTAIRIVLIALVGVSAITWTTIKLRRASMLPPRFAVVMPGMIYRSAQPSTAQIQHLVDQFGLRTLLIVREGKGDRVAAEIEFAKKHGLNAVLIPLESRQSIPERQVEAFFQCVDDRRNHPVLIHCSAGRHRTGYLCARYRVDRQGWQLQKAIDEMMSFGFDSKDQGVVLEQLRNYHPSGRRQAEATTASPGARTAP